MSRHGLTEMDDYDTESILQYGRWRGRVASATRGRRGQVFLRQLIAALEAMPYHKRELAPNSFQTTSGCRCALGAALAAKGVALPDAFNPSVGDPCERDDAVEDLSYELSVKLDIAEVLAQEVMWVNDEFSVWRGPVDHPQYERRKRWAMVHRWATNRLESTT